MLKSVSIAVLLMSPLSAFAQNVDGFYIGGALSGGTSDQLAPWYERLTNPSGQMFAGYNFTDGPIVIGAELNLRANLNAKKILEYTDPPMDTYRLFYKETFSPIVSVKAGTMIGSTFLYGKMGMGASFFQEREGGTGPSYGRFRSVDHQNSFVYSAAVGAEFNFDRYFLRLESEYRSLPSQRYYENNQYQFSAGFGVRF